MTTGVDQLIARGVLSRLPDGRVQMTRSAWLAATVDTKHQEPMIHFVGFKDDRWWNAIAVFGRPHFIHRFWDARAIAEVVPGDIVVFADGNETDPVRPFAYDDSAYF